MDGGHLSGVIGTNDFAKSSIRHALDTGYRVAPECPILLSREERPADESYLAELTRQS